MPINLVLEPHLSLLVTGEVGNLWDFLPLEQTPPCLSIWPLQVPSHGVVTYPGWPPPPPPLPTLAPCPPGWGARMGRGRLHSVCKGWATALAGAPQDWEGEGAVGMEEGNGVKQKR